MCGFNYSFITGNYRLLCNALIGDYADFDEMYMHVRL
jgi:hypothetical protein